MKPVLETLNVFLDTSIFIEQNYIDGRKLKAILQLAEKGLITLYTTDITKKEVLANVKKDLLESRQIIKRFVKSKEREFRIVNKTDLTDQISELEKYTKEDQKHAQIETKLLRDVNKVLNQFSEIKVDGIILQKVLNEYFKNNPPFNSNKDNKKSEFPDAFVLVQLEEWCKNERELMYVVSKDGDMNNYPSTYLLNLNSLGQYLDKASLSFSDENLYNLLISGLQGFSDDIIKEFKIRYAHEYETSGYDSHDFIEYSIESLEVTYANVEDIRIIDISVEDDFAKAEIMINYKLLLAVTYEDLDNSIWDSEDKQYIYIETVDTTLEVDRQANVEVEITHIPVTDRLEKEDFEYYFDFEVELDGEFNQMDF